MRRILPVFLPHAGCKQRCSFCDQRAITGAQMPPSPEEVDAMIQAGLRLSRKPQLAFYGGSFTAMDGAYCSALLAVAAPYTRAGEIASIRISTRPDAVDEAILAELWDAGVRTIELGAQSMCDDVLARANRGHTAADTKAAAGLIRERGFSLGLQTMIGLPGEGEEKALFTAREIIRLRPDFVRMYPLAVLKGSPLHEEVLAGTVVPLKLDEAVQRSALALSLYEEAGIPVVRIGLPVSGELSSRSMAAAGVLHENFGQMVRSRLMLARIEEALRRSSKTVGSVRLLVPKGKMSDAIGFRRENIRRLNESHPGLSLSFVEAEGASLPCDGDAIVIK